MSNIPKGYKQTEVGVIPEDWEVRKLGDGINLLSGHHVLAQYCNTEGNGFPYITGPADFPSGSIQHSKFTVKPTTICRTNDILVTVKGSGAGTMVLADAEYSISRQLMAVRVTDWNTSYIYYSLMQDESVFGAVATGLIPGLSRGDILNKVIPLPTKAEQTAIAAALSDADALISSLEKLIAKKRNVKQGAMQQLLKPKDNWAMKKLGEVAEIKDGTHQTPKYVDSGIPFYSVENVTRNDYKNTKFISHEEHLFLTKNYKIEKGDILMTRIGSIGDCKYVDWDVDASFYVSLALLKIREGFSSRFICHYSNSAFFKKEIELNSLQSAIPKKINLGQISNIKLEIPTSIEEQTAIAQILSDMDAEIEQLEQKLDKYRMIKQGMMQELLTGKTRLV